MEEVIKENKSKSHQEFEKLLSEDLGNRKFQEGEITTGIIEEIGKKFVFIDLGLKSSGAIPLEEFKLTKEIDKIEIGSKIDVLLERIENRNGEIVISHEKARRAKSWKKMEKAFENKEEVKGSIISKCKGGFVVNVDSCLCFLPASQLDLRPLKNTDHLMKVPQTFECVKLDKKRGNIVLSRRAVIEKIRDKDKNKIISKLKEGDVVQGIVKNLTDWGAFIDLNGADALLHITDMSWKRIKHPSEVVEVGYEVDVKILKFDRERNRVSLGLKQLGDDPWVKITNRYPVDSKVTAKVTNLTDYGCFAELEEGVEGLVHVSEMDWTNKNVHPSKVVQLGDEVEVMVLEIDQERRRISLGIKQCQQNPWDAFGTKYAKGEKISGTIKSITDFGIFIGLEGDIDGLVHLSDISWNEIGEEAVRSYNRGDEIETVILSIDSERERISLGIKQLDEDPFMSYTELNEVGSIVVGEIVDISSKALTVKLAEDVNGVLKANELSLEAGMDIKTEFKIAEKIESKILSVDKKSRVLTLSVKAKNRDDEQEAIQVARDQEEINSPGTIGDLIKAKMDS